MSADSLDLPMTPDSSTSSPAPPLHYYQQSILQNETVQQAGRMPIVHAVKTLLSALETVILLDDQGNMTASLSQPTAGVPLKMVRTSSSSSHHVGYGSASFSKQGLMDVDVCQNERDSDSLGRGANLFCGGSLDGNSLLSPVFGGQEETFQSILGGRQATESISSTFQVQPLPNLNHHGPTLSPLKRRRQSNVSDSNLPCHFKSHRTSVNLSSRFEKTLHVHEVYDQDPSPNAFNRDSADKIAQRHILHPPSLIKSKSRLDHPDKSQSVSYTTDTLTLDDHESLYRHQSPAWNERRKELEYNLMLIQNGVSNDSYEDIRAMTDKILQDASYLSNGDLAQLQNVIPIWRQCYPLVMGIQKYLNQVQDMSHTIQSSFALSGHFDEDMTYIVTLLNAKKELYDNVLKKEGIPWKLLGLPVPTHLIAGMRHWIYNMIWMIFMGLDEQLRISGGSSVWDAYVVTTMKHILKGLHFASDCVEFAGSIPPKRIIDAGFAMATVYVQYAMAVLEVLPNRKKSDATRLPNSHGRSSEAKIVLLFENVVKVIQWMGALRGDHVSVSQHDTPKSTDLPTLSHAYSQSSISSSRMATVSSSATTSLSSIQDDVKVVEIFAQNAVEAGLKLCQYIHQPKLMTHSGKTHLVMALACKFVNALAQLGEKDKEDEMRLKRLASAIPMGELVLEF